MELAQLDAAPRLVRDRLRLLNRAGILDPAEPSPDDRESRSSWSLSPAGQDLVRLLSLMARIASNAANVPASAKASTRDRVVGQTLTSLSDPVVLQIGRCLAPEVRVEPLTLEERCAPTPRRTVYRRLAPLVDAGAVVRTTTRTVPRRTHYALADRWRPAAAILLLSAWWGSRHHPEQATGERLDLEGLIMSIRPLVNVAGFDAGSSVRWTIEYPGRPAALTLTSGPDGLQLDPADRAEPEASVTGTPAAWASALVTNDRAGLQVEGDVGRGEAMVAAVRFALLSYIR